ncbi:lysophospholipid acyltransferase family protein [Comamonas odontotermitis]|uniref:lysophospholipid acyltransferase family protein n=1 Tax=Comamonas odontotermitis TaxID=379895 RepID=UPI001CC4C5BE|nr:lysophospholipid acyltransferase family protein [Comamonas odontotermitis]UBB17750.1 1-acyl-sn-glycerol-3-phosphate acyltransferase [Comamonas odontotermitis]
MAGWRRKVVGVVRLGRLGVHIVSGVFTIWSRFDRLSHAERNREVERWAGQMLRHAGVELQVLGQVPSQGPLLLVANHLSWLDIPAIHASKHCRFVSKSDVKAWPVIGSLASAAGTLFIERTSRRDAMRTVTRMEEAIRSGDMVAIFPEGTTGDGSELLPFHANLLQAAIAAESAVQPLGLCFYDKRTGQMSRAPSYVGDESLLGSIWRTVTAPPLVAQLRYGVPQDAQGRNRRDWSDALHGEVDRLRQVQVRR